MSALKRLGLSGVITMKMIITTSSTSISGVTLMNGTARLPFALPMAIEFNLPFKRARIGPVQTRLKRCADLALAWWSSRAALLNLIGNQADLVHALFANSVNDLTTSP